MRSVRLRPVAGLLLALALLAFASAVPAPVPESGLLAPLSALPPDRIPSGLRGALADLLWLDAVQRYGTERRAGRSEFPALEDRIRQAVRMDPELRAPAVFGALLLAEPRPLGPGRAAAAAELLDGWVSRHPDDRRAALTLGLVRLWHLGDPEGAARVFDRAASRPGAPPWFQALAARSFTQAGARETARPIWERLLAEARTDRERSNARTHLAQLDALEEQDRLAVAIRDFERRTGRTAGDWEELIAAGVVPRIPLDPAGVPYRLVRGAPEVSIDSPLAGIPGR